MNATLGRRQRSISFRRIGGSRPATFAGIILAATAVSPIGCSRDETEDLSKLVEDLRRPDAGARYTAVKALGNRGAEAKEAVPAMIALLKDNDAAVRTGAAYALGKLGQAAASAVPALTAALDDPKTEVRLAAAYSLPALGPDATAAWKALQKTAAQDRDASVRQEATNALAKIETAYKFRRAAEEQTAAQTAGAKP